MDGFRFHFYSDEGSEPPHIHVSKAENEAKFWLDPVGLTWSRGFNAPTLNKLRKYIIENQKFFLEAWNAYFSCE